MTVNYVFYVIMLVIVLLKKQCACFVNPGEKTKAEQSV